jgi:hypothetical protein
MGVLQLHRDILGRMKTTYSVYLIKLRAGEHRALNESLYCGQK